MADVYVPPVVKAAPVVPSPTGTPVVKPNWVPLLLVLLVALNGAALALSQSAASPGLKMASGVVVTLLSSLMGILSPGARKGDGVKA